MTMNYLLLLTISQEKILMFGIILHVVSQLNVFKKYVKTQTLFIVGGMGEYLIFPMVNHCIICYYFKEFGIYSM